MNTRGIKFFYNIVGSIALLLAMAGAVLPLLPVTPFLLLAAACFMRGSARMHDWLIQNPYFGKHLRDFQEKRGVTLRVKITAITTLWASMAYSIYVVPIMAVRVLLPVIGVAVTIYLIFGLKTLAGNATAKTSQSRDQTMP